METFGHEWRELVGRLLRVDLSVAADLQRFRHRLTGAHEAGAGAGVPARGLAT